MTGEATVDRAGLLIDDKQQGWRLRLGEISNELIASQTDLPPDEFTRWQEDIQQTGPVFGFHWSLKF